MKKLKIYSQETAAAKAGMDVKTARKYLQHTQLPSEAQQPHTWKTRTDIFEDDWPKIEKMLELAPGFQAHTLMHDLIRQQPKKYNLGHLRTLQRRIRDWRAQCGAAQPVIFRQDIKPGRQSQSDFTNMNDLYITINNQCFNHLLFHFMLPYSRWESIYLCFSESFESMLTGYEIAVWKLGYVAREHRTDNLTAATKAMGSKREFTERWLEVMTHYGSIPTTNNIGVSHENGSVEKSHDTLKNAIDQSLLLRGNRDFATQQIYLKFVETLVSGRNAGRKALLQEDVKYLIELPDKKWLAPIMLRTRVSSCSVVQILEVPYTVPSRLIHYTLKAYVYPEEIILFYGNKVLQRMPRLNPKTFDGINYRHIIDSLIRKPGAFANYRYHEALFPRLCFRQAYDELRAKIPANADKNYLQLLQLAKNNSEQEVSEALELLLEEKQSPTAAAVKELIHLFQKERLNVKVQQPNLTDYDELFSDKTFLGMGLH